MRHFIISISASLLLGACGTANYLVQDTTSGQIQLDGSYMHSVRQAKTMMVNHCEGEFEVLSPDAVNHIDYICVDARISARDTNKL